MTNADNSGPSPARHPVNHIGVTVPDIFAAIDWYRDVLGFEHIMGPRVLEAASAATAETRSVLGSRFRRAYQLVYCRDPFGLTLELMSHPYEEVFRDWPQAGMTAEPTWLLRDGGTRTGGHHPG